jgi:hypothetical protein
VLTRARNVERIVIGYAFTGVALLAEPFERHGSKIKHLETVSLPGEVRDRLAELCPSLTSITTFSFCDYEPPEPPTPPLTTLSNFYSGTGHFNIPFRDSSRSTLKTLEIGFLATREFDFTTLPLLTTLHVYDMIEIPRRPQDPGDTFFLWPQISKSTSLETLILSGPDRLASTKFSSAELKKVPVLGISLEQDVKTLRRLELRGKVRQDRIERLFKYPMSGLKILAVPRPKASTTKGWSAKIGMEKIVEICENRGVELRYSADSA